ncbi:MAG: efflux RND transporter periplasmic adaptor subunit [Nitrospirae bacterium]|nr:efflux RND transporter periplasmic adaptor subunit [Nitrospirota bacterium]
MRRGIWLAVFVAAAGLTALGVRALRGPADSVQTATVVYGDILDRIAARGKVEARTTVDLAGKIDGRIQAIAAKEGEGVAQGQIVIRMDDEYAMASVNQARAELKEAELNYSRSRRLLETRAVSKAEFDRAAAKRDLARAHLEMAEALLSDMSIASPIPGRVIAKYREAGESVTAGIPIMTIADVSTVRVRAEIDEDDVGRLALGQEAAIHSDAYPGRIFTGKVIEIGEQVGKRVIKLEDPSKISDSKILEAKIDLAEPVMIELKLGMTVDVKIDVVRRDRVLKIPRRAIQRDEKGAYVQVVKDNRHRSLPEIRRVVLGGMDPWDVEVLQGLNEKEKVVVP